MKLTLIRHGQTPSNIAGLLDTAAPGPPLSDLGRRQASAAPRALDGMEIDAIFASTLVRTQQTAAPLAEARGLEVTVLPGLREIEAGEMEMAGDADSIHRYIGTVWAWLEGDVTARMPGAETGADVLNRIDSAMAEIVSTVGNTGSAVAVSHGAAIRFWAATRVGNAASTVAGKQHLDNTGAVTLELSGAGEWTMQSWRQEAIGGEMLDDPEDSGPTT